MVKGDFLINNTVLDKETIKISKNRVAGNLSAYSWTDKDTGQFVIYVPSLEITGYGEDISQALEMLKFSVNEFMDYLMSLSKKDLDKELLNLKFKKNKIYNKEFSKAYINIEGELQNFNAVDNKVERLTIESA